ncbi:mechanosensitive ion channel family protein [Phyllobacterium myrsinacearum]|uniref:Small-conductance mechanosensitive channel/CRP-like cAMP-binding protein n=1 Tax=Phyllobacterium myrsinacearum TaxID=28101 RepID=A0A839ELX4_9HYPH|nr:mechanosensitive ion channel family protein [Phyllobacterium myrsinacearum]MBA8881041.1 small-conductance mechanosensitive channel/CRP-like cAMP-binding protein [Phyllobacterium myrsinacearum]
MLHLLSTAIASASPLVYIDLVGILGMAVWRAIPKSLANLRLVVQIVFFIALSAMLPGQNVIPYVLENSSTVSSGAILIGSVKAIWWVHLAWALIGFVRIYLVFEQTPREARLLQDIVVGAVYLGLTLSIAAFVFGVPVGTLIATSGVFAIILGLALQNTLSDAFSGIALNLGRPYVLGDWIVLSDGTEGRVVESNWRSTHLLTGMHNVVVLPNSLLAKLGLTNVSSPDETHGIILTVRLAPTRMPAVILEVMRTALTSCNTILKQTPPVVALKSLNAEALEIELIFQVAHVAERVQARNEVLDLVYRHCKSAGLLLAKPASSIFAVTDLQSEEAARPPQVTPIDLINAVPIFTTLTDEEREVLAATTTVRSYRKDEAIVRQGEMMSSLMIIRAGVVVMLRENGANEEVGRLAPGDFFGETGLLAGMGEASTLQALTHVVVYEINQQSFAPLLLDRPALTEDLAFILSRRAASGINDKAPDERQERSVMALLKSIRTIFRG